MILLTIEYVPGREIEALGLVKGTVVQSKNFGKDFMAGMKTIVGGEIRGYTEMLIEARQIATKRMVDEAEALGAVSGGVIISFPRLTDCGIAMDETFRCTENEISAGENTIQMLLERRMFPCLFGFPGAKKCQDRLGRWRIHMLQQFLVKRLAGGETFQCSLGLALVVDP